MYTYVAPEKRQEPSGLLHLEDNDCYVQIGDDDEDDDEDDDDNGD